MAGPERSADAGGALTCVSRSTSRERALVARKTAAHRDASATREVLPTLHLPPSIEGPYIILPAALP